MNGTPAGDEPEQLGPVARMMISVSGHAITSYVQFRALCELLIERGVIDREALEQRFALSREGELERTIDEWFAPDIAYHLKMAVQSAMAQDEAAVAGAGPTEPDTIADTPPSSPSPSPATPPEEPPAGDRPPA